MFRLTILDKETGEVKLDEDVDVAIGGAARDDPDGIRAYGFFNSAASPFACSAAVSSVRKIIKKCITDDAELKEIKVQLGASDDE